MAYAALTLPRPLIVAIGRHKLETLDKVALKIIVSSGIPLQDRVDAKIDGRVQRESSLPDLISIKEPHRHPSLWKMTKEEGLLYKLDLSLVPFDFIEFIEMGNRMRLSSTFKRDTQEFFKHGQDHVLKTANTKRYREIVGHMKWLLKQRRINKGHAGPLKTINAEIKLIQDRLREFHEWFISQKLEIPKVFYSEDTKGSNRRLPSEPRVVWKGNKGGFAAHIIREYEAHPENYNNMSDAVDKIYRLFKFSFPWSKNRCHGYLRNLHRRSPE
jgi:hypothetical protein